MDPTLFLADLEQKPARLADLAAALRGGDHWGVSTADAERSWLFVGMGSSAYAAQVAAARLRSHGVRAVAELAATDLLPNVDARTTVVAITASGGSAETLDACRRLRSRDGGARFVALTEVIDSPVVELCDDVVPMWAGPESGGVACRTFQHTLALLLTLEARLLGAGRDGGRVPAVLDRAAEASAYLLDTRDDWLPAVSDALLGPSGTHVVAPARRTSSALSSRR
jgi:fructoselysine-6-P-deglycase FrlB-like protein